MDFLYIWETPQNMFTGIIETLGIILDIEKQETNLIFNVKSDISKNLKVDQSVAHDGVCLTVIELNEKLALGPVNGR